MAGGIREVALGEIGALEAELAAGSVEATAKQRRQLRSRLRRCEEMRETFGAVVLVDEFS